MSIRTAIFITLLLTAIQASALVLQVSPTLSNTGTFNLTWQGMQGETYRLFQLTENGNPQLIYQGTDTARVMTGLSNGDYTYQVQGETDWSEQRSVTVSHHSLARASIFFGIGLLVFLATLFVVVRGEKDDNHER